MDWNNYSETESITRYLYSDRHFNKGKGIVHAAAYNPLPHRDLSVYRIWRLSQQQIWNLAEKHISPHRQPQRLKARGDLSISDVLDTNLVFNPDTKNHKRHAVILGWPDSRDEILELTAVLAIKASLHVYISDNG